MGDIKNSKVLESETKDWEWQSLTATFHNYVITLGKERDAALEVCHKLLSMGEEDFDLQVFNEAYILAKKVVEETS